MRRKKEKKGIFISLFVTMIICMIVTSILSLLGLQGEQTIINANGALETYLVSTNNIFSKDGFIYLFGEAINNFLNFKPFVYLIISLISLGILDSSGLLNYFTNNLRKLKFKYLTILVIIISLFTLYIGDYAFVILLPLVAEVYKKIGKNPILGIITVFLTLTFGYSLGIFANYNTYYLGTMTELSAQIDVDKNYTFNLLSNFYITIFSSVILIIVISNLIENKIAVKFSNPEIIEENVIVDKKAAQYTFIIFTFCLVILGLLIMPNIKGFGPLLDTNGIDYISKLFGEDSAFSKGLPYIILLIVMISSFVYGKISKNIKNSKEYGEGLFKRFDNIGPIFVVMFFSSQLIGLIEWTNVGNVITINLLNFMSSFQMSGLPLIVISFILIVIMGVLIPSSVQKWVLLSPVIIPLFMRSNITPNYTQFLFGIADGVGKALTPIFPYYILMIGLVEKYKTTEDVTFYSMLKMLLPTILVIAGILFLLLVGWFLIGLPLGINTLPSL